MGWTAGGIFRRWKILSGPSTVLPDFLPDSQGTGGLPGRTELGCRWWVASTFRPVIMLPTFPRLDQTRSSSSLGPSCVNQMPHGEARAVYWSATHTHVLSSRLYQMDIVRSLLTRPE